MSDLEDVADRLRAFAVQAGPLSAELESVLRELAAIGGEVESLAALGLGGEQVLGLIERAVTHARGGADAVMQVGAKGQGWADHLANRGSSSTSMGAVGVYAAESARSPESVNESSEESDAVNAAESAVAGVGLSERLAYEEAAAVFSASGGLSSEVIAPAQRIVDGCDFRNQDLIERLTSDGSNIDDWAKYTTRSFRCPSGTFQVHFYMNKEADVIHYECDYKAIFGGVRR
jgi:hypothetical protein